MTDNDWWIHGQRYDAPDGSESFMRFSTVLYRLKDHWPNFYELVTQDNTVYGEGFSGGDFVFEDVKTGFNGRLVCTETTCTVYYDGPGTAYIVSPAPHERGQMDRLDDFDHRQVPARIYTVRDTTQVIYLSRWVHGSEHDLRLLHWIDLAGGQTNTLFIGSLRNMSIRGGPAEYRVDGSEHRLCLWPTNTLDTGVWQQLDVGAVLEAAPLENYRITHGNDGTLVTFGLRG